MISEKTYSVPLEQQQPKWCALFVRVNQEKHVAHHLESRGVEHFLPTYLSVRNWKDRQVRLERPLFPGYVFVRLSLMDRMKAVTVPNVLRMVGPNGRPSTISEDEISWIRRSVENGSVEPYPQVATGVRVVITSGILCGLEGIFLRQENNRGKVRVVVPIGSIERAFVVEVENGSIIPINYKPNRAAADDCRLETVS